MKLYRYSILFFFTVCVYSRQMTLIPANRSHGFFIAPVFSASAFGPTREIGYSPGFQIGWVLDHHFTIGVQANQLWSNVSADWIRSDIPLYLNFSYAGLRLSYISCPDNLLHMEIYALYGQGYAGYREQEFGDYDNIQDLFRIITPGLVFETNMTYFFRVGFALYYPIVHGIGLSSLTDEHFSGLCLCAIFKFGIF